MEIYFVRHGQTDGNLARRHQHQDTELNELGQVQVKAVAKKVAELDPTHIVSSTNYRAVQTAKIIVTECESDLIPETHPAFEEFHRPDWLIGNRYNSFLTIRYVLRWFYNFGSVGETYDEFLVRILEARKYLESLPEDGRVVVVSHAVFINIFLEHICRDKRISLWRAMVRFWNVLTIKNGSMLHLRYIKRENQCSWEVVE